MIFIINYNQKNLLIRLIIYINYEILTLIYLKVYLEFLINKL